MPALSPGAVVEYSYLQGDNASMDYGLRFPKWYLRSPESEETFLFSQYVVRVTPGTPFVYAARNLNRKIRFERKREAERKARCAQQQGWTKSLTRDADCRD